MGLVEHAGRAGVIEQWPPVDGLPAPFDGAGEVGGDDMRVEQGISGAAGSVVERGGDHPVGGDPLQRMGGPVAAPSVQGVCLDVCHDGIHGVRVGLADLGSHIVGRERPEHADRLGWSEGEVIAGPGFLRQVGGLESLDLGCLDPPLRPSAVAKGMPPDEVSGRSR
jgi:hypothetical protein